MFNFLHHKSTAAKSRWAIVFLFLVGIVFALGQNQNYLYTSIIPTQSPEPYNGTALPVLMVPKWTALSSTEWNADYNSIPSSKMQSLPNYDPNLLKASTESLGWSSTSDLNIRNAKITFSVPYMGNYKLDGVEYAGGHLAVDIKIPVNTPIYSIGNGVVTKAVTQSTGFGNHIVVKHMNFPSYASESTKEMLFSSYSHLSEVKVKEGDLVRKGQLIGLSGETGTATTPHLHFQIDNTKAPWHPYWPFTYQEADAAGYTFTEAINEGLNKEKAIETTVNPMLYVQKYLGSASSQAEVTKATDPVSPTTPTKSTDNPVVEDPIVITPVDEPVINELPPDATITETVSETSSLGSYRIASDGEFYVNKSSAVIVEALDENGAILKAYKPSADLTVSLVSGEAFLPTTLTESDFRDGKAKFYVNPLDASELVISVSNGSITSSSDNITVQMFSDLSVDDNSYRAVSFLKNNGVVGGYPDGSFQPKRVVSRVEALKFILNGINANLISTKSLPFTDTYSKEWYSDFVATGYNKRIVEGYSDSTFKPSNIVNRAEFLKMLLTAMNIEPPKVTRNVYDDVALNSWYAPYVQYAKEKNLLVINNNKFKPEEGMSREEVAEVMYRMIMVKLSGAQKFSSGIQVSTGDIQAYFS